MNFPSYVPEGARSHALHFLGHYEPYLVACETELTQIQLHLNQDTDYANTQLIELRQRKAEKIKYRDDLARDIANIRRLVHDTK